MTFTTTREYLVLIEALKKGANCFSLNKCLSVWQKEPHLINAFSPMNIHIERTLGIIYMKISAIIQMISG